MLTTLQIINVAKISQYLAIRDITVKGLFGGGVDLSLPNKIYNLRKSIEYWYDLDPSDTSLVTTGRYLMAICGIYGQIAQGITGGSGTVAAISGTTGAPPPYDFKVDASTSFIIDGQSTKIITLFLGYNLLFTRGGIAQSTVTTESSYYTWDKATATFTCVPAAITSELFQIYPI
jgi:hypothetical protein